MRYKGLITKTKHLDTTIEKFRRGMQKRESLHNEPNKKILYHISVSPPM
jgi:hypothetical protein